MTKLSEQEISNQLIVITTELLSESGEQYQREVKMDMSLQRHLGIDSLGRSELFARIEKIFNVSLPDKLLIQAETLGDIAAQLSALEPVVDLPIRSHQAIAHHERIHVDASQTKTLIDILQLYAKQAPDKGHIFFQDENGKEEVITYGQMLSRSLRVANGLRKAGLKENETVAIMQPTHPGFFYTFYGVLLAGGIPVPIYPPFRMHMLEAYARTEARILNSAEVRILVTFDRAENLSRLLQTFVRSLRLVTTVDDLMDAEELQHPHVAKSDSFAFIQYTSGSTSDPKGVLLSHANLLANIRAYGAAINVQPDDVAVSWLPLYHDMGLIGMWFGSLYFGVPLILLTPFTFLNRPERWLWAIHYHRGTISAAPNFAYELCTRKIDPAHLEGLDLSSWRVAANGAEKIYPNTLEEFNKKFMRYGLKPTTLLPVYGLAESTVGLAIPPLDRGYVVDYVDRQQFEEARLAVPDPSKSGLAFVCCGKAIAGHAMRIVNEAGQVLPERHVGKLQFRGPSSMQGYYNNPRATEAIYHDGWYDSGDLAYLAEDEVYITGRLKDLIIKAGRNLYPVEIEEMVGGLEGVRQGCVAAFGMTDHKRGTEQLVVVAETREQQKKKRAEMIALIKETISTNLDIVPDHVILVKPHIVPKTSSGKLQRSACKKMYLDGKLNRWQLPAWVQVTKLGLEAAARKGKAAIVWAGKLIYTAYALPLIFSTLLLLYAAVRFASHAFAQKLCRYWCIFILYAIGCPIKRMGEENLRIAHPVIYAANHMSYLDAIVAIAIVPAGTRFIGKKELLSVPLLRTFIHKLDFLPVDRMDLSKGLEDARHIEATLKSGHSIFIFPEGTFSYATGLRPFRMGAFKVAAEASIPICPIALFGTRTILRGDEKLMRPARITVTVCPLIYPHGVEWKDVTALRNEVRAAIAAHCGEPLLDFIAAQTVAVKPLRD